MVWNVQSFRPVRTSYAWTSPGGISFVRKPSAMALPTTTTSPAISERRAAKLVPRTASRMPTMMSTLPSTPNSGSGSPVRASIEISRASLVPSTSRSSVPSVQ